VTRGELIVSLICAVVGIVAFLYLWLGPFEWR
jgi:hypothetical protein